MSRAQLEMAYAKETVDWLQKVLELSDPEIGRALGATRKTIQRWRAAETAPQPAHRRGLDKLNQLRHLLESSFRSPAVAQAWFHRPIPALAGRTPLDTLVDGGIDRVLRVLGTLATGAHV